MSVWMEHPWHGYNSTNNDSLSQWEAHDETKTLRVVVLSRFLHIYKIALQNHQNKREDAIQKMKVMILKAEKFWERNLKRLINSTPTL